MAELACAAQLDPIVRETAIKIVSSMHAMDYADAARRIVQFVRRTLRRIDEGVEMIQRPEWLLKEHRAHRQMWGDCDDAATLVATLTTAIGIPTELVALWPPGDVSNAHVFTKVFVGNEWRMADAQADEVPPGPWEMLEVAI